MDDLTIPGVSSGVGSNEHFAVSSQYNKISETVRRVAPTHLQCTVFCGGKRCKYETNTHWASDSCAITGIYSHWITDDVAAMSRPNTSVIAEYDILGQFDTLGIKSIINLEVPGEHASCSLTPLHSSGFAYDPSQFMNNGIYFYNYAWRDYGEASLAHLLDMVKVLSFAVTQGKVAVHCHAGLGRTGVLIACYLVYSMRLRANDAVRMVRNKRPGSIQSRLHILCVQQFEQFILPNCIVFCNRDLLKDKKLQEFTLQQYLKRQRFILHGKECKTLRHIPKVLNVICERFLTLCGLPNILPIVIETDDPGPIAGTPDTVSTPECEEPVSPSSTSHENNASIPSSALCNGIANHVISSEPLYPVDEIVRAFLSDHINMSEGLARYVRQYRLELNHKGLGAWIRLGNEKNLYVLSALLLLWLEHLRIPLFGSEELTNVVLHANNVTETLKRLPLEAAHTVEYLLHFVAMMNLEEQELEGVLKRLAAALTHRIVPSTSTVTVHLGFHTQNPEKGKSRKLNEGTLSKLMLVLHGVLATKRQCVVEVKITSASTNSAGASSS